MPLDWPVPKTGDLVPTGWTAWAVVTANAMMENTPTIERVALPLSIRTPLVWFPSPILTGSSAGHTKAWIYPGPPLNRSEFFYRTEVRKDLLVVEPRGLEPLTSALRTRRSTN